jgi:hypothetical protein
MGKQPKSPINCLTLTVFNDDPSSVIFRVRKPKDENDDGVAVVNKEYDAYIEDDDIEDDEEDIQDLFG